MDALRAIAPETVLSNGYSFQVELAHRVKVAGLRSVEVPIHFTDRTVGSSKMSLGVQAESLMMPWRLRRSQWRPETVAQQVPARG